MKGLEKIKNVVTIPGLIVLILGVAIGWFLFGNSNMQSEDHPVEDHANQEVWTCSMHPQIREDGPGQCPICGMDLVVVDTGDDTGEAEQFAVKLSPQAMKIAEVSTAIIESKSPYKEIHLPGKVVADERRVAEITSRFPGRIELLNINFTGQKVQKGQVLASIYSPEMLTAQKELLEALKLKGSNPNYYNSARQKLKLWTLTDSQIDEIEEAGEVKFSFDILSPISGTVVNRHVSLGDYVKEGTALFEVIDLSRVWITFDASESDLPWIGLKDEVRFSIKAIPGETFTAPVTFIDPVLNPASRSIRIRTELNNPNGKLKPQMLVTGILKTMLPGNQNSIVVPKSAVLWTGKTAVVYVLSGNENNLFRYREIELGAEAGSYYVVKKGLEAGEVVASNGVFKIDAAAQLQGKQSMMNPEGGKVSTGHDHGEVKAPIQGQSAVQQKDAEMERAVDVKFQKQLGEVYAAQLKLQEAFIESDAKQVTMLQEGVSKSLSTVDMSLVKGSMHELWMTNKKELENSLAQIKATNDLGAQRLAYADFSEVLFKTLKMFGTAGQTVFYQFCPMAREGEGAYWLSSQKEILNPYYGAAMLNCGETVEELK